MVEDGAPKVEQLESLSAEEWRDLYRRLRLFTWKRYGWLRNKFLLDPDELAQQAISDTLVGKRRWPPVDSDGRIKSEVSLFVFLCQVIRSNVSHLTAREMRNISAGLIEGDDDYAPENLPLESFETLLAESARIHPNSAGAEGTDSLTNYVELRDKMRELVATDGELSRIVELLLEDSDLKPTEIAERLGLSLKRIYVAMKRLRRTLRSLKGRE